MNAAILLSEMPTPTKDLAQAKAHLDEYGFCVIAEVLKPEQVAFIRRFILAELETEEAHGKLAVRDWIADPDDKSRRLWRLPNRHGIFCELIEHPIALEMMRHQLGDHFLLSSSGANVPGAGNARMQIHVDQAFAPTPFADQPLVAHIAWMIDEFTPVNGATRVVPRSHLMKRHPEPIHEKDTLPVTGPAGSIMVLDGRLWHQTGSNQTQRDRVAIFNYYCRSWVRCVENWDRHLAPHVWEASSPALRRLFGHDGNPMLPSGEVRRPKPAGVTPDKP